MALSKRGGGYSRILRISLLLVVCIVILECQAAPAGQLGWTKAREPPEEEKLTELDLMAGQEMFKSRSKRATFIPGIPLSKLLEQNGTFQDGKLCLNGEEPFTPDETKAFRKDHFDMKKGTGDHTHADPDEQQGFVGKYGVRCINKQCTFDPKSSSAICGTVEGGIFENGKHCFDGSDPPALDTDEKASKHVNKQATKSWGKWCKSKKCNAFVPKNKEIPQVYICSSTSLQPILLLLVTLFGLCVLRSLQ